MHLQHAEIGCLFKEFEPSVCIQFPIGLQELCRIGAIGALERAAVGQFREHGDRRQQRLLHSVTSNLSAHSCRKAVTSSATSPSGASYSAARSLMIALTEECPSQRRRMSRPMSFGQNTFSGESTA